MSVGACETFVSLEVMMTGKERRTADDEGEVSERQSLGSSLYGKCDSPWVKWSQEMRWRKVLVVAEVEFGQHMAMSFAQAPAMGDTLLARQARKSSEHQKFIYIYTLEKTLWSREYYLSPSGLQSLD